MSALVASSASGQISGVSITNLSDADSTTDTLTNGNQRLSARTFTSNSTSINARMSWVTAADSGIFTNASTTLAAGYRINFTVNVPGAYQLTVGTNWNGAFTTVSDATTGATADVSALTGSQTGGTLASGGLGLADPGNRSSNSTGNGNFAGTLSNVATITGTSNGANVPHTLQFNWTSSCVSNGGGDFTGADECAVRAGIAATISGQSAGNYPGPDGRNIANDGHFANVTIVSLCGNSVVDGSFGEQCDEGGANGTPGSCCTSSCQLKANGTQCRGPADVCDAPETCNGVNPTCPADAYLPPATVCRASSSGEVCDEVEFCTGSGVACPADAVKTAGTECRGVAGGCDVAEQCDGSSKFCPTDGFLPGGTECRASGGVCDIAEQCSGGGPTCPADAKSTAVCRASGGVCDLTETCDGVGNNCPADAKSVAVCRAAGGICDLAESCDGSNNACPSDAKVAGGTECRGVAGICDVAEQCDGSSNACPTNGFVTAGTECRGVAGICDVAEQCTGSGANCPADGFEPASTVCRASSVGEVCDIAENCTGSGANCPADAVEPASTVCRASSVGEICDIEEFCDGTTKLCGPDVVEPSTTVCRASSVGEVCDITETCDGTNRTCPPDAVEPATTVCRGSAGVCDVADTCDGSSKFCTADGKSTAQCRASGGVCDVAESCDGSGNDCPADGFVSDGTNCEDSNFCNGTQTCTGGVCGGGTTPCGVGESCDEGSDICFLGECPVNPSSCRTAQKNKVLIKNKADNTKDKLVWKWTKGDGTTQPEFGDPLTTATYALCFYAGASPTLINSATIPPAGGKWAAIGTKGYKYKDTTGANDGITKVIVKGGAAGKSKALVKGKGMNLPDFDSDMPFTTDLPLIVQLRNNSSGVCWQGSFATPKKDLADQFNAKTP